MSLRSSNRNCFESSINKFCFVLFILTDRGDKNCSSALNWVIWAAGGCEGEPHFTSNVGVKDSGFLA